MKLVAYYRVSRKSQAASGLGLAAQRQAVESYAAANGGRIVAEFQETESGKRADRIQLAAAIARTRAVRGTLVIAKLDRLSRSVSFTSALMESGIQFVCCDNPNATPLVIHIVAAMAQAEREAVSDRTKRALAVAKRNGTKLGTHRRGHRIDWRKGQRNGLAKATAAAAANAKQTRDDCYSHLLADVQSMRESGLSYASIAERLNDAGHVTTSGKPFAGMTVHRLLAC